MQGRPAPALTGHSLLFPAGCAQLYGGWKTSVPRATTCLPAAACRCAWTARTGADLLGAVRAARLPETGELSLTTPIGGTLAQLHWSPGEALLKNGSDTRRYASLDALIEAATGAAIPLGRAVRLARGRNDPCPAGEPTSASSCTAGRRAARHQHRG